MNRFTIKLLLLLVASILLPLKGVGGAAIAQSSGTNSTYSRFGLGLLQDQSNGFNKSMGGVGLGVRMGNRINTANPASYSAIDSLSFILDVGMSGSFGKMKQASRQVGVNNATLDFVHAGMHVAKGLGLAVGYMPYTSIGYKFSSRPDTTTYDSNTTLPITHSATYNGSGGLNQAYIGLGWKAYKGLSVGANVSLLWGKYSHTLVPEYMEGGTSSNAYSSTTKSEYATLKTYKIDLGVQYPVRLTRQDWVSLGTTVGLGHKIAQDVIQTIGEVPDTAFSPFDLPYSYGIGAAWQHKNTLLVAADVRQELWSNCRMPIGTSGGYLPMKGYYKNMTKIAIGSQWTPDPFGNFWERIQYRAGMNFSTPYLKVDGANGPKEFRLCFGAGVPILNRRNNRSIVNFGVQWLRRSASGRGMVKEDYFVINLGMTFNERWFMKYKIE